MKRFLTLALAVMLAVTLAGCASLAPDGGSGPVLQAAQTRLGAELLVDRGDADRQTIEARVQTLLDQPLTLDAAVQIALLNHRGFQARLAALGVAEADRVQALRLPNPGFSFARLKRGDEIELERGFHFNLAPLLLRPWVSDLEDRRMRAAQRDTTQAMLSLAFDTRKAFVQAVAAEESVHYMRKVMDAAEASAELARRMQQVGNFSRLQRAREQGFYADAALNLAQAERQRLGAHERLVRQLGLWGAQTALKLPPRLPSLPDAPADEPDIERRVIGQRLDVAAAAAEVDAMAARLGVTRGSRFIEVLEVGALSSSSNEAPSQRGWEVGIELPLFDFGDVRVARGEALLRQRQHEAAALAIDARSQVREAYGAYRSAYDIARHHIDEIVPLRRLIADENLLRYNGMLIGVFELLADARAQVASVHAAMAALRDFWLAKADLDMALIGPASMSTAAAPAAMAAEAGGAGH